MFDKYDLQLFAEMNTQTTGTATLSDEMKVFYSDYLIDNAVPKLVHDQFGQKHPIPKNGGKTIEFRKYNPLPKLNDKKLVEGVTPDGQSLHVEKVEATVEQYGGYVTLSDVLLLTAIDNNLVQATKLLGNQAGATLDTVTREKLMEGTNVLIAGGGAGREAAGKMTVDDIKRAVRKLKSQNAERIGDSFVAIIHPDVSYDLTSDPAWQNVKDYDPKDWYEGEIGRIHGVRFVETTEAKIITAGDAGTAIYATLVLGDNAYGVTEIEGGGLQHIVKQLGSAGTSDPLDQRATVGWKAIKTAEILVDQFMVRIESIGSFDDIALN